jgi:hypothetical protein
MNRFDKRKQFRIDLNEARRNPQRNAHFAWIGRRENGAERRLGRAFEHRLALFVETGHDGVVLFETDKQARQWRLIIIALFEVLP